MKKAINTVRIATIALWPIIFLLIIGAIERSLQLRASLTFQPYYILPLLLVYIFWGCVFAFNIFCEKEFIKQKIAVFAHVFSAISFALFCLLWLLHFFGIVRVAHSVNFNLFRIPIGVFSLVLGLTIFASIRAVLLYKRRCHERIMRKTINTVRIATVALWPIIFLLIIGAIELRVQLRASLTFQSYYRLLLIPVYIFSGCVFAFNMFCEKEFIKQKITVFAYTFSAISAVLFCLLWLLHFFGIISIRQTLNFSPSRTPVGVFSLILGFTIFTAIRAVLLYRKGGGVSDYALESS